jgi:NADH-quinone oxidoreductase subunit H
VATFVGGGEETLPEETEDDGTFDAFAGGYPVPPQGNQQLPELAGVLVGEDPHESKDTPSPRRAHAMPADQTHAEQTTREEQS